MNKKTKDDSLTPKKQNNLHFFFANAKAKAEAKASDDSIVFLKEIKAPTPRGKKQDDPELAENDEIRSSSFKKTQNTGKSPRLRDVLRRRAKRKSLTPKTKTTAHKPPVVSKPQADLVISSDDDEAMDMHPVTPTSSPSSPPLTRKRAAYKSPAKSLSKDVVSDRASDTDVMDCGKSIIDGENEDGYNKSDGEDEPMPVFSLKILDSQEYSSAPDSKNQPKGPPDPETLSGYSIPDSDSETEKLANDDGTTPVVDDQLSEDESPSSQPLSIDPSLLSPCTSATPVKQSACDVIILSSSSEDETEKTHSQNTCILTAKSVTKFEPRSTATSSTKKKRKAKSDLNRLDVTKQLFPPTPSSDQGQRESKNISPAEKPKTRGLSSPSKTIRSSSKKSKTWGPKSARKARSLKELQQKRNHSDATETVNADAKTPSVTSTPVHKKKPRNDITNEFGATNDERSASASSRHPKQLHDGAATPTEDGGIFPDENLEDIMLSLDHSNTYSPSKNSPSKVRIPYYLANVRIAVNEVINSPFDKRYFNMDDDSTITAFHCCEEGTQMLYMRMLFRRYDWIPVSKLDYTEVGDINTALKELIDRRFIVDNNSEESLHELLNMMAVPRLKKICMEMKITVKPNRTELIRAMLKHASQQTVSSMLKSSWSTEQVMIKRVRKELPMCYKLTDRPRDVFLRILMLYALVFEVQHTQKDKTSSQLIYTMLRETMGQIRYPLVPSNRQSVIFLDREHVLRRRKGEDLEERLESHLSRKAFDDALPYCDKAKDLYKLWMADESLIEHDKALPPYLRRYTCTAQIIRCLGYATEVLQKVKQWQKAADLIETLLSQDIYSLSKRGYWYDRLALIYDFHIKAKDKALGAIRRALSDDNVRVGYRLSIYQRLEKLRKSQTTKKLTLDMNDLEHAEIIPAPNYEISGATLDRKIPDSDRVNVFVTTSCDGSISQCSVETVALQHYMSKYQLNRGLHAESSVFTTIYGLLFWDVIYMPDIPDTFYNLHQYQPLDFQTDLFYERRREMLDKQLNVLRNSSEEDLLSLIDGVWSTHYDVCSVCVSWNIFSSPEDAVGLILCMGVNVVADMCERFIRGYRFCRSGMPDLTMWNADTKDYKIVEVKGPNDKLSTKQILWLDFFMRRGAQVEVCYVKVSARSLNHRKTVEATN